MLLDYDFLLLLNDESGNPTRYYYLLQDFEKDFVASKAVVFNLALTNWLS